MTQILLNPTDCASISAHTVIGQSSGDVNRQPFPLRSGPQIVQQVNLTGWIIPGDVISVTQNIHIRPNPMTQAEKEFLEQKEAFLNIPPLLLEEYHGKYVVSHNGQILDSDFDLSTLTARFFGQYGDLPVYIEKVGGTLRATIDTPFFD